MQILKKCPIHGDLTREQVSISRRSYILRTTGLRSECVQIHCKACRSAWAKSYFERNKERLMTYKKAWLKENVDKRIKAQRKSYAKHREKRIALSLKIGKLPHARAKKSEMHKRNREELGNDYIKKVLIGKRKIPRSAITPELVEAHRAILTIKRKLREINKDENK